MDAGKDKTVLFVDDEEHILSSLRRLLRKEPYRVLTAAGGAEGLRLLEENEVHMIVSDQRMPDMEGTAFLQKAKESHPGAVRVILSGYADVAVIVDSINKGEVYRFLGKPWNDEELKAALRQCLEHYEILQRNQALAEQTRLQNERLQALNERLEEMVDARTRSLQLSQEILEKLPLGVVGISREGEAVITNAAAARILDTLKNLLPGTEMDEVLPADVAAAAAQCLERNEACCGVRFGWNDRVCSADAVPLGKEENRGCILMLRVVE